MAEVGKTDDKLGTDYGAPSRVGRKATYIKNIEALTGISNLRFHGITIL